MSTHTRLHRGSWGREAGVKVSLETWLRSQGIALQKHCVHTVAEGRARGRSSVHSVGGDVLSFPVCT